MSDRREPSAPPGDRPTRRVAPVELFFDLVFVFTVTQLSLRLRAHFDASGAAQTALLFAMMWLLWAYTIWVTNWTDASRLPTRLMLLCGMLASLVFAVGVPDAFTTRGLAIGVTYAVMQIGRSAFAIWALGDGPLRRNFQRILVWCCASGALALGGATVGGTVRFVLWGAAVGVDVVGGAVGFFVPRLGKSLTTDWTIEVGHLAERCEAFVLLALGESLIVMGSALSGVHSVSAAEVVAFAAVFAGCVGLWWCYFDRAAEDGAEVVSASADPGRLGRSAYHFVHPVIVAGIILFAAGDERVISAPATTGSVQTTTLLLGGIGLYLAGHAGFKSVVFRVLPLSRLIAIGAIAVLGALSGVVPVDALAACATLVVIAVNVADYLTHGHGGRSRGGRPGQPGLPGPASPSDPSSSVMI